MTFIRFYQKNMNTNKLQILRKMYQSNEISKEEYIKKCQIHYSRLFDYPEFLKESGLKSIEITENDVIMTTKYMEIKLVSNPVDTGIVPNHRLIFSEYEKDAFIILKNLIGLNYGNTFTMIDAGANTGWFSINFALSYPSADIHSFEPVSETYNSLLTNIKLNKVNNISPIQIGLSDNVSIKKFYYDKGLSGNASLVNHNISKSISFYVNLTKIDNYCKTNMITPDFIKIDVEGAELLVINGAIQEITNNHPILYVEMLRKWSSRFNYHPNDIIELLNKLGYSCYTIENQHIKPFTEMTEHTTDTNFLFLHKSHNRGTYA